MRQLHPRPAGREGEIPASAAMAASSVVAVVHVSLDGRVAAVNATLARLMGEQDPNDLTGRAVRDILEAGQDETLLLPSHPGRARRGVEIRVSRRDGGSVMLRGDVLTLGSEQAPTACGIFIDCTEIEQLRQSLQHSARLEALASLTGGVAHDFNNLLTVLIGNLSLVAEELRGHSAMFAKLKSARDAATRGSALIRQLLGFAGAESLEIGVIDPSHVITNVVPLLDSALGRRVRLETQLSPGTGSVEANAAQLESVIVNLAVNARDAIADTGTVTVSSHPLVLAEAEAHACGLPPGDYVRIRVADDGAGVAEELHERIFEPFFSTKKERGGTGLGLSMVRSFARKHGGHVEIRSRAGEGTAISVLLPRCAESSDIDPNAHTMPLATLPTGTEHVVLLVADPGLGSTISQILEVLGYTVAACADPTEIEALARERSLDLLICDEPMPGPTDTAALVERLRRRHSALRWIRLLDWRAAAEPAAEHGAAVLVKPFSLADLASLVRDTLGRH